MEVSDQAYLNAYQRLREMPIGTRVEILAEWEMFATFGEAADHVWMDEWPKSVQRVRQRYMTSIANPHLMTGDIWFFSNVAGGLHTSDDSAHLCPYNCETHSVPKGA